MSSQTAVQLSLQHLHDSYGKICFILLRFLLNTTPSAMQWAVSSLYCLTRLVLKTWNTVQKVLEPQMVPVCLHSLPVPPSVSSPTPETSWGGRFVCTQQTSCPFGDVKMSKIFSIDLRKHPIRICQISQNPPWVRGKEINVCLRDRTWEAL